MTPTVIYYLYIVKTKYFVFVTVSSSVNPEKEK